MIGQARPAVAQRDMHARHSAGRSHPGRGSCSPRPNPPRQCDETGCRHAATRVSSTAGTTAICTEPSPTPSTLRASSSRTPARTPGPSCSERSPSGPRSSAGSTSWLPARRSGSANVSAARPPRSDVPRRNVGRRDRRRVLGRRRPGGARGPARSSPASRIASAPTSPSSSPASATPRSLSSPAGAHTPTSTSTSPRPELVFASRGLPGRPDPGRPGAIPGGA